MTSQMHYALFSVYVAAGLFIGMLCLLEVGRRVGQRRREADAEGARAGLGVIEPRGGAREGEREQEPGSTNTAPPRPTRPW